MIQSLAQTAQKAPPETIMNPNIAIPIFIGICTIFLALIFWLVKRSVSNFDSRFDSLERNLNAENKNREDRDKQIFDKLDREIIERHKLEKTVYGLNGSYVKREDCNRNYQKLEKKLDSLLKENNK